MAPCTGVSITYNVRGGQGVTSCCPPTTKTVHIRQSGSTGSVVNVSITARVPSADLSPFGRFPLTVSSRTTRFDPPGHPQDLLITSFTSCSRSALFPFLQRINAYLLRWVRKKIPQAYGT
jgi:hypothetical protein